MTNDRKIIDIRTRQPVASKEVLEDGTIVEAIKRNLLDYLRTKSDSGRAEIGPLLEQYRGRRL